MNRLESIQENLRSGLALRQRRKSADMRSRPWGALVSQAVCWQEGVTLTIRRPGT